MEISKFNFNHPYLKMHPPTWVNLRLRYSKEKYRPGLICWCKVHIMQLDLIRFAKSPFYFWPIIHLSVFPAQFWIFSKLLIQFEWRPLSHLAELLKDSNPAKLVLLEMSKKDRTNLSASKKKINFVRILLISVNKVPRLRTRLVFKIVAGNI